MYYYILFWLLFSFISFLGLAHIMRKKELMPIEDWNANVWQAVSILSIIFPIGIIAYVVQFIWPWLVKERGKAR